MVTHRRIIVEKHRWLPVQIDDGTDAVLIIILLAGLGLIGYALLATPSHRTNMAAPADNTTSSASAPASSNNTGAGTTNGATGTQ
jgi:hypothetical protein